MASETDLHISKRLQAVLPALTDEEQQQLEENIIGDRDCVRCGEMIGLTTDYEWPGSKEETMCWACQVDEIQRLLRVMISTVRALQEAIELEQKAAELDASGEVPVDKPTELTTT